MVDNMGFWNIWSINVSNTTAAPAAAVSTAGFSNTFGSFLGGGGFFAMLAIIVVIALIIAILAILTNWESYKKMKGVVGWLFNTLGFFIYGIMTIALIGIPAFLVYTLAKAAKGNPTIFLWVGGIIVAYFAISGLGWLFKKYIYSRIAENIKHPHLKRWGIPYKHLKS
jgi:hypothetical protein